MTRSRGERSDSGRFMAQTRRWFRAKDCGIGTHIDGIRGLISDMFVTTLAVGVYNEEVVGE